MNQIRISVIVPMYNVQDVICRSVSSLYSQTMRDFEIIFVDDCSTDSTLEVLKAQLKQHNEHSVTVKIISHEVNEGVAAARNTGLDNAAGDYIYYVDADDFIDPNALECLYTEGIRHGADIVGCEWLLSFSVKERYMRQPDVSTGEEAFIQMTNGVMRWNLWLYLAKRSLYEKNDIRFISGMNMGEDMMVMMKLMLFADKVQILHKALYHYIQTNQSSLTKDYRNYKYQITTNINAVECFLEGRYVEQMLKLKLAVKLPLLISDKIIDYDEWQMWFPEANVLARSNYGVSWRTFILQFAVYKKQYWLLKLYHRFVIRFIYGIIYR